jgi:hypothetical protein
MNDIERARLVSDALVTREPIPGLEVTELPPAEGALQWRLAVALLGTNPANDFANTVPAWEA